MPFDIVIVYLGATWPGGADAGMPKRYANNLAALQAPPVPLPPPPAPSITLHDGDVIAANRTAGGGAFSLIVKLGGPAMNALLACGMLAAAGASGIGLAPLASDQTAIAGAALPLEAPAACIARPPTAGPFAGATFRFAADLRVEAFCPR